MTRMWVRTGLILATLLWLGGCDGSSGAADDGGSGGPDTVAADGAQPDTGTSPADVPGSADAPRSDTPGGVDAGGRDTGSGTGGCTYTSDCPAPKVCRDGACVDPCPGNPCPQGWTCVTATGVCWQQCFTSEDCSQLGYRCEGQRRCVPGCPWHPHYCAGDAQCDPVHGECTPGFCLAEFSEVTPDVDRVFYGPAEPGSGSERSFTISVLPYLSGTRTLDVRLGDVSDDQVQITGVGLIQGENVVAVDLPATVSAGERYAVFVAVDPTSFAGAYGQVEIVSDGQICVNNPVYILTLGRPACISAQPSVVQAGDVAWGDVVKKKVRLRNDCDHDVTIVAWNALVSFSDWMVAGDYEGEVIRGDGGTLDFEVFFAPTVGAPGGTIRNTKVLVVFDDPANRVLELALEGRGVD